MNNEHEEEGASPEFQYKRSALIRHYVELGQAVEGLRHAAAWTPKTRVCIYNIFIRFPRQKSDDTLMIVKGIGEGGPMIAFHGGMGLVDALISFGQRYMAGKVGWREDLEPPASVEQYTEYISKQIEYLQEKGIGL